MKKIILFFILCFLLFSVSAYADYEIRDGHRVWVGQMIINPVITGGTINNTPIGATTPSTGAFTTLSSTGTFDADRYYTIWIPANQMTPTATNGATAGTEEKATNDKTYDYYAFDTTTEESIELSLVMPAGWDRSTIKIKFYWFTASGSSAGDTVEWEIGGCAISNDDSLDVAMTGAQVITDTVLAGTNGDLHVTSATPAITIQGTPALGDMIHYKISRNVAGTDDMVEDAYLVGVDMQIKITNAVTAW